MNRTIGDARIRIPSRIQQGETIPVSAIVQHPMDTGFFRSADGQPIPAYFIKDVTVAYDGPAGGALHVDVGHQSRSGGDLHAGRRPRRPAHDALDRQQGRRVRADGADRVQHHLTLRLSVLLAASAFAAPPAGAQVKPRYNAFTLTTPKTLYPLRQLAPGVFVVAGDTGKGVEGRPNAGFVDSPDGLLVVGGLASPVQGEAVVRTIRTRSSRPIRWFVLYAHHPDMQFGAIAMKRAGAAVIAHPDANILAAEGGPDQMVADWDQVVGLQEMLGFEFANVPDRPVTGSDTLMLGTRRVVVWHPGDAHSPGDLMLWLPDDRILFTGDVLVEDGVTMVIDGSSRRPAARARCHRAASPPGDRARAWPHRRQSPGADRFDPELHHCVARSHARRGGGWSIHASRTGVAAAGRRGPPGVAQQPVAAQCQPGLRRDGA